MFKRIIFCIAFINIFSCTALAEGIIPVICTTEFLHYNLIKEYNWKDWSNNPERDVTLPIPKPIKVYSSDGGHLIKEYSREDEPNNPQKNSNKPIRYPIKVYTLS